VAKTVDYFFAPISPWTYLGSARFRRIAEETGAKVNVRPVNLGKVFPATGGLPLAKRAPERQAYRLVELKRWSEYLGVPIRLHPKHFPADDRLASRLVLAARERGEDALALAHALGRAVWEEERDIADVETLVAIAGEAGLDGRALLGEALKPEMEDLLESETAAAIESGIFGAPSYVIDGEIFWGQDRLDFVERKLKDPG